MALPAAHSPARSPTLRAIALGAGTFALLGGLVSLAGWMLSIPVLTDWDQNGTSIKTNAALCLAASGASLILHVSARHSRAGILASRLLAALSASIGLLTLSEHVFGVDLGIDQLLASEPAGARATVAPNRMGPPGSLAIGVLGIGLLLLGARRASASRSALGLGVTALLISSFSLIGYAYGATELFDIGHFTGIALQTSLMLHALGWGVVASAFAQGEPSVLVDPGFQGTRTRRLVLIAGLLPLLLGYASLVLQRRGLADAPLAAAAVSLSTIVILVAFILRSARAAGRAEEVIRDAQRERQALLERERAARLEAEKAGRVKDEFIATVSHELRNPLSSILSWSQVLGASACADAMHAQAAKAIERSVRRQAQLVDDLLDISRIVAGKLLMDARRMDLLPVIRSAIATLGPAADAKRLVIDLVPGGNPSEITGDPDRLEQVMWNLLSNAVKFTPAGGKIAVRLRRSGSQLEVSVIDTGCGIPAHELPYIFERFRQGDQARQAKSGLGLGLAIAKHLVELHGGSISAASPGPGLGTTISLLLPGTEAQ